VVKFLISKGIQPFCLLCLCLILNLYPLLILCWSLFSHTTSGANVNALDRFGGTPLQDAQRRNTKAHQEVIKVLEAHGAVREQDIKMYESSPRVVFTFTSAFAPMRKFTSTHARSYYSRFICSHSIRHTAEFISSLQKSLPLLCDRGDWSYVEVLIESEDEKQFVPCAAYWFSGNLSQSLSRLFFFFFLHSSNNGVQPSRRGPRV
jgi:hypothetical protein